MHIWNTKFYLTLFASTSSDSQIKRKQLVRWIGLRGGDWVGDPNNPNEFQCYFSSRLKLDSNPSLDLLNLSISCIPRHILWIYCDEFFSAQISLFIVLFLAQISPEKLQNWWIHLDPDQVPIVHFKTKKIIKGKKKLLSISLSMQPQQRRKVKENEKMFRDTNWILTRTTM